MLRNAKPAVLITGATGRVGAATCRALNYKFSEMVEIRAGIRNPLKALRLNELASVQQVAFDTADLSSLMVNLRGVERLCIIPPTKENRVDIVKFIIDEALKAGVNFICLQSILVANSPRNFQYGKDFSQMEDYLKASGVKFCILRSNLFMENYLMHRYELVDQREFATPLKKESRVSFVSCEDLGLALATVLANPVGFEGRTFHLSGPEALSQSEIHMIFETVLGFEIKYREVPMKDRHTFFTRRTLMPEWQARGLEEVLRAARSDSIMSAIHTDFSLITGVRGTAFRDWLAQNKEEFLHPIDLAAQRLRAQDLAPPVVVPASQQADLPMSGIEAEIRKITIADTEAEPRGVRAAAGPFGERAYSEVGTGLSDSAVAPLLSATGTQGSALTDAFGGIGSQRAVSEFESPVPPSVFGSGAGLAGAQTTDFYSGLGSQHENASVFPHVSGSGATPASTTAHHSERLTVTTGLPVSQTLLPGAEKETEVSTTGAQGAHGLPLTNQSPAMSREESINPVTKAPSPFRAETPKETRAFGP